MSNLTNVMSYCLWVFFVAVSAMSLTACESLPKQTWQSSVALNMTEANQTRLGQAAIKNTAGHDHESGIFVLSDSRKAFASRAVLIEAAEKTIDAQYYIWRNDITGTLLLNGLLDAANRGVRVRLLLDDMNIAQLEPLLLALNSHNNVEIRLFNPFQYRSIRAIDYVTAFSRVNRRMHNKSFTFDNTVTVVGGRNIGDEYFGASDELMFADVDVLAVGPVVEKVSTDFDAYWASESAIPLEVMNDFSAPNGKVLKNAAEEVKNSPRATEYIEALRTDTAIQQLIQDDLPLIWAATYLISDDPAKGAGKAAAEDLLSARLTEVVGSTASRLTIVSAYFVPTKAGTEALANLAKAGINVTILTNSLEATDVAAVHAGYARYRKQLIKAGIDLYEMRAGEYKTNMAMFGSSAASLHAKTFAIDDKRIFIGSFNFDPRSANLNTELGFVIDSPELASKMEQAFAEAPERAYQVMLDDDGGLYWVEQRGEEQIFHSEEPYTGWWKRFGVSVLSVLPIEWLL